MRTRLTVLALVVVFAGVSLVQAQGIKYGVGAGLNLFTGDLSKDYDPVTGSGGLGYTAEPAFGVKAKLGLPMLPLSIAAHVNYTMMKSELTVLNQTYKAESSLLTIGAGVEFSLIPGPLSPYLAADLLYNSFGTTKITGMPDQDGESRFGVGIGAGIGFNLMVINLDLSAKYNLNNLIGKEDGEPDMNTVMVQLHVMF